MATLKKATTLLEKAKKSKSADTPKILTESHELILKINDDASVSPDDKAELLVTEAEIAFDLQNFDLANNDVDLVMQNKKHRKEHATRASYMKVQMLLTAYNQVRTVFHAGSHQGSNTYFGGSIEHCEPYSTGISERKASWS